MQVAPSRFATGCRTTTSTLVPSREGKDHTALHLISITLICTVCMSATLRKFSQICISDHCVIDLCISGDLFRR
jgi:hypothetical protein